MAKRKLTPDDVAAIREAWDGGRTRSVDWLAAKYKVSLSTISAIIKRQTWNDSGIRTAPPTPMRQTQIAADETESVNGGTAEKRIAPLPRNDLAVRRTHH